MAEADRQLKLSIVPDTASAAATAKINEDAKKSLNEVAKTAMAAQNTLKQLNREAAESSNEFKRLDEIIKLIGREDSIDRLAKQFFELGQQTDDSETQLVNLLGALKEVGATDVEIDKAVRAFKELEIQATEASVAVSRVQSAQEIFGRSAGSGGYSSTPSLQRVGSSLRQLGAREAGDILSTADDIGDVTQAIKAFSKEAIQLPGLLGQMAQAGAGVGAMAGTTGAALGALAVPLLAIAIPVGALALAINDLKGRFEAGHDAVQKFLDDQNKDLELRTQIALAARTMTSEELKNKQDELKVRLDLMKADIEGRQRQIAATKKLNEEGNPLERMTSKGVLEQQYADIDALIGAYKELNREFDANNNQLSPLIKQREAEAAAIRKTIDETSNRIQREIEVANLMATGTVKGAEDRQRSLSIESSAIEKNIAELEAQAGKNKEVDAALAQYRERLSQIHGIQQALNNDIIPYLKAKEAEDAFYKMATQGTDEYIKNQQKYNDLIATGSSEGVKNRIDAIDRERKAIEAGLPTLDALGETNEEARKKAEEYRKQLDRLNEEQGQLTSNVLPLVQAREAEEAALKRSKDALEQYIKTQEALGDIQRNIDKLREDRAKQIEKQAEDDARNEARRAIEEDYRERITAAKRAEAIADENDKLAQAEAEAEVKRGEEAAKIDQSYFDAELKAYQKYRDAESAATDRYNKERLRSLEKAQMDLQQLAAAGDVAGFVERSNQAKLELRYMKEDADDASRQRLRQFEDEVEAARAARERQIRDLEDALAKEAEKRQEAHDQRIAEIEAQGQESNLESARLEQQLNDIREQWRREDLERQREAEQQAFEDRLNQQIDMQNRMLDEAQRYWDEMGTYIDSLFDKTELTNELSNALYSAGSYEEGTPYVPQEGMYNLHEGERVLTKDENIDYSFGGGSSGDTYNVNVKNVVGDVATQTKLDEAVNTVVSGVEQALKRAKGRGRG